ncbi:MAG: phage terminase large subunit family protein, partial [Hyphomicrobiaceae bacterium]
LTVSEWADQCRKLSSESSAEPGTWNTARAEYQRGIMDAISAPGNERVVLMTSAQVGKTEIINNVCGFHIAQDAAPILVLQPTLDMAQMWSKDRLAPMLRDTPALKGKVADPRARDSGNTVLHKRYPGGHITVVGANSPSGLAARPIRVMLADEVDRYPVSAGSEGDPLSLALKRTTTFWNRRIVMVSTPTTKGLSRIEAEWLASDQRRFYVPCEHCDKGQVLTWSHVEWPEGQPDQAAYICKQCGVAWSEQDRLLAVRHGEWIAERPEASVVGFHLSELYSPWSSMAAVAASFVESRRSHETRKTWVNTCLGEPYEEEAAKIDGHELASRAENWGDKAPLEVLLVTAGVDVQGDRLEVERVGWGINEESWSLDHQVLWGDPSDPDLWRRLDAYLLMPTIREDDLEMPVRTTCIDSGGHFTQQVYKFAKVRRRRRVFAIKGRAGVAVVWPVTSRAKVKKVTQVVIIGVDAAKDAVYAALRVEHAGASFCHFPVGRPNAWFEQLTAEVVQTKYTRGFPTRVYYLSDGRHNEALDCRVYAYAALQSLNVRWGTEMAAVGGKAAPAEVSSEVADQALRKQPRARGHFLHGGQGRRTGWLR